MSDPLVSRASPNRDPTPLPTTLHLHDEALHRSKPTSQPRLPLRQRTVLASYEATGHSAKVTPTPTHPNLRSVHTLRLLLMAKLAAHAVNPLTAIDAFMRHFDLCSKR